MKNNIIGYNNSRKTRKNLWNSLSMLRDVIKSDSGILLDKEKRIYNILIKDYISNESHC